MSEVMVHSPQGAAHTHRATASAGSSSSTGRAGEAVNNPSPESGDLPHAYVENGTLYIMEGGQYVEATQMRAWAEWFWCASSPMPSTQERARQIRAAMDEAYPQELAA